MTAKIYEGRFGYEHFLFELGQDVEWVPAKDDFVFYDGVVYKIMYVLNDYDHNEIAIFVRKAIEEDY